MQFVCTKENVTWQCTIGDYFEIELLSLENIVIFMSHLGDAQFSLSWFTGVLSYRRFAWRAGHLSAM